jgi:predicted RNase H-like HicB family nuclease
MCSVTDFPEVATVDTVQVTFNLVCTTQPDGEGRWIAICPRLDVVSQGDTEPLARKALQEAIELWVQSCLERETLEEALVECGFHRTSQDEPSAPSDDVVLIQSSKAVTFNLAFSIPAYQAAAALAQASHA